MKSQKNNREDLSLTVVLRARDFGNSRFIESLTAEQKKSLVPFVLQRYFSTGDEDTAGYNLIAANQITNTPFVLQDLDLFWNLSARISLGNVEKHAWIPPPRRKKDVPPGLEPLIRLYGRGLNDDEVSIVLQFSEDHHRKKMEENGWQDQQVKEVLKILKRTRQ
jgi:hypothetical protein